MFWLATGRVLRVRAWSEVSFDVGVPRFAVSVGDDRNVEVRGVVAAEVDGGTVSAFAVVGVVVGEWSRVVVVGLDAQLEALPGFECDGGGPDLHFEQGWHTGFEGLDLVVAVRGAVRKGAFGVEFAVGGAQSADAHRYRCVCPAGTDRGDALAVDVVLFELDEDVQVVGDVRDPQP
jgi:hypothetical protein